MSVTAVFSLIPTIWNLTKKNPVSIFLGILLVISLGWGTYSFFALQWKKVQLNTLEVKYDQLEFKHTVCSTDLVESNMSIDNQNKSINKYKGSVERLEGELARAVTENVELGLEIDDILSKSNDAPLECKKAFIWLQDKATEIKQWQN